MTHEQAHEELIAQRSEELARACLPILFERLESLRAAYREALGTLEACARPLGEADGGPRHSCAAPVPCSTLGSNSALTRIDAARVEMRAFGYCLGLFARGSGTDLLRVRCERDGLRMLAHLLEPALAACTLVPGAARLPTLAPGFGGGWALGLCMGSLLLRAAGRAPRDELRWQLVHTPSHVRWRLGTGLRPSAKEWDAWRTSLPGLAVTAGDATLSLSMPRAWFGARRAGAPP